MSQKHGMHADNETVIKEVLKLVALSELLQENLCDNQSNCSVSAIYYFWY